MLPTALLLLLGLLGSGHAKEAQLRLHRRSQVGDRQHGALQPDSSLGSKLKRLYPWYHTSEELAEEAKRVAAQCGGNAEVHTASEGDVDIQVATVRKAGHSAQNRVFIIFGEHSRELISPESGLYFLRVLCGLEPSEGTHGAAEVLQGSEFQLVLNANPRSRKKVEAGSFCTRANPDGVDLNRNWGDKWQAEEVQGQYPGPYPFSEPETRIFRQLVTSYKPTTFITVHSGTRGLYMPWAYDKRHLATRNRDSMLQILKGVDKVHCQCPYGAAGKEVGYACPGTCLDWVYDKLETPYSFAFEIYTSPSWDDVLTSRWQEKLDAGGSSLLERGEHLAHPHFLDLFQSHVSDFVQTRSSGSRREHEDGCFEQYNPDSRERFNATLRNWAGAYLDTCALIVKDLQQHSANTTL